jgi:hypothetical protein
MVKPDWNVILDFTNRDSEIGVTPYEKHRGTPLWGIVAKTVSDLVENGDIVETTHRDYIVGYICESLHDHLSKPGSSEDSMLSNETYHPSTKPLSSEHLE